AEQAGMAIRIPLATAEVERGFRLITVVGVKTLLSPTAGSQALETLLDGHHYARGLAFVRQGIPAHNLASAPAGYPPDDPNGSNSFVVERGDRLDRDGANGVSLATALGVPRDVFSHIDGADLFEQRAEIGRAH